jgi:hypothetical protein
LWVLVGVGGFQLGANLGLDILAMNTFAPYSRQVDCVTLALQSRGVR